MTNIDSCRSIKRKEAMPDIVGENIKHRWKVGKRHKWFHGKVLRFSDDSKKASFSEDITTDHLVHYPLYDVQYDGDDEIYALALETDWYCGDLELKQ